MATYFLDKLYQNNMERSAYAAAKTIVCDDFEVPLANGDILAIGALPRQSITTDFIILVPEDWDPNPANTTISIGYYEQVSGTFTPFATDVQMKRGKVLIPGPIAGTMNPDGTPYTGDQLLLWNGDKETEIAVQYTGASTPVPGSECILVFNNVYYGTKNGKYGLDYIPMRPARA